MVRPSAWQSSEAYAFVENLPPALLAWEWLRRNGEYQSAYVAFAKAQGVQRDILAEMMQIRWGIRFPD